MVVAFATLRGAGIGAVTTVGVGFLVASLLAVLAGLPVNSIVVLMLMGWLPTALSAEILRRFASLPLAVGAITLISVITVVVLSLLEEPLRSFWLPAVEGFREMMAPQTELAGADAIQASDEQVISLLRVGAGITVFVMTSAGLFLGRSGQARLHNPGGFQREFHALYFGKQAALVCLVLLLIGFIAGGALGIAVAIMALFPLLFQGLAVIHSLVKERSLGVGWLVGVYVMLMFVQPVMLLIGGIGLFDNLKRLPRH